MNIGLANRIRSATQKMELTSKEENQEMMAVWPDVVRNITEATKELNSPDVTKWMEKILQYNVLGGKKIRGLALIYAYKILAPNDELTEDNIHLVRILAWCIEVIQAGSFMLDDIIDRSLIRRGRPCWYRYNDIGMVVFNDCIMLENAMYYIIRKFFKGKECYVDLLETFQDIILKTIIGQCFELLSTNFGKKPNLNLFTMNRYNSIVEYKTSYYTFVLPITAAMHLAGIKSPEMFRQAKSISLEMGRFFQIQDDYLACFGDSEVCGKDDTDIQEGKCTWFVVTALQRVTPEQRKILEECYGVSDPEKITRVKQLFNNLNLLDAYLAYEEELYNLLNVHIQQISCELLQKFFLNLLKKIYRRTS